MELVHAQVADDVATIRLNDPGRRNALSVRLLTALISAFDELRDVRAVVLRAGADDAVWSAGFDIAELDRGVDPLAHGSLLQQAFSRVRDCPAPVIAMLHGSAWGGGCDLALRCDILIGDPTCSLAFTPAKLGLPYDPAGLLNLLLRAGRHVAMEMLATAEPVSAARALDAGLLNHLVEPDDLEPFTYAMARRIAELAPLSIAAAKLQLRALAEAMPLAPAQSDAIAAARQRALWSADFAEGLRAFRERRPPDFAGN